MALGFTRKIGSICLAHRIQIMETYGVPSKAVHLRDLLIITGADFNYTLQRPVADIQSWCLLLEPLRVMFAWDIVALTLAY